MEEIEDKQYVKVVYEEKLTKRQILQAIKLLYIFGFGPDESRPIISEETIRQKIAEMLELYGTDSEPEMWYVQNNGQYFWEVETSSKFSHTREDIAHDYKIFHTLAIQPC
jgi:hypothetical protein